MNDAELSDDLSQDFIQSKQARVEDSAAAELLAKFAQPEAQPEQPVPEPVKTGRGIGAQSGGEEGGVIADIASGIIQSPRAIAHGAIDAVNEVIDLSKEFDDYMTEKFGNFDIANFEYISPEEFKSGKRLEGIPNLPNFDNPESTTGQMIEGISQFLVGFALAGKTKPFKALKPATKTGQFLKASAQGAAADFAVFDPHEDRLSDLVQAFPALQNPVNEYLAADPEDSAAEGRFKNALEGLGIGAVTEGFMRGLKLLRSGVRAKVAQADEARIAGGTEEVRREIPEDAFKELGDTGETVLPGQALDAGDAKQLSDDSVSLDYEPDHRDFIDIDEAGDEVYSEPYTLIEKIEVNPEARGQGKARQAMKDALQEIANNHPDKPVRLAALPLDESTDPQRLVEFYESLGFKLDEGDFGGADAQFMTMSPEQLAKYADIEQTPGKVTATPENPETFINFARIDTPEDVQNAMQQLADAFKGEVDGARRGAKKSFYQMELDANQVDAFETLAKRRQGEPLNAEQSIAARQLWATSADKLAQLSKKAAQTGSEADLFAFRKMVAVHRAIQNEVIAARTETARALASWRIPVGSNAEKFMQVEQALNFNGGSDLARDMAGRVSRLAESGNLQELDQFVQKSAYAKTRDAMLEAWINALLSGPKTHMVNAMSNTTVLFQQMYERKTAAKIAQLLGDENSVQLGEAMVQYTGMVSGFRDAVRYAAKAFKTGESGFGLGKVEMPADNAISAEALNIASGTWLGRAADVVGTAVNLPSRALGSADEFFKTLGYRMELNALALRKATQEVNAGQIAADQLNDRIADILENPPREITLAAIDQATYQTFTNTPGKLAQIIQIAKHNYPGLNIILPFVRTPANIMNYTFERTPLAPLFKHFRADIAAGGARRDLALSRMATGTALMLVAADMAMSDQITGKGPSNRAERNARLRTGWQPYSVKVGDRYYAYNRMDPIGTTLGLSADLVDILANDDFGPEKEKDVEQVVIATAMSIANNAMSKTYLSGMSDLVQAMADPERYGEGFFQRLAGSVIPTGVAEVTRMQDPYMRETRSMVDSIMRRTPGLSDRLPLRRNLWGEPITYQSGLGVMYDAFSPIYSKSKKPSPIDEEILKHEMNITMPNKRTSFNGATVDLDRYEGAYSRYVQLAGNELKHPAWGLGARDLLNEIVSGKHALSQVYQIKSDGPDGGKFFYVRDIINQYRELARTELLKEYPEIKAEADEKKAKKLQLKMPVFGGA